MTRPDTVLPSDGPLGDPPSGSARVVMSSGDVSRALRRVAHEILERNRGAQNLVVLGIPPACVPLARRLVRVMPGSDGGVRSGSRKKNAMKAVRPRKPMANGHCPMSSATSASTPGITT